MMPIKARETAHQACEQALRRAVITGELGVGERLPPERALAVTLGVSRLTLRAALAALTAQGLIAVRHGSGYLVRDYARDGGAELLPVVAELAAEHDKLAPLAAELLRVRRHLARAVLEHLAEYPPKVAAIRAFDAAVDAMAEVAIRTPDPERVAAADLAVVAALLDATSSPVLRLCLNPVVAVVTGSTPLRAVLYAEPMSNVAGWRALAVWLKKPTANVEPIVTLLAARDASSVARLAPKRRSR
jgi:GntR family transcriptional repressor for pyruvate dehydrogenase complex